MSRRAPAGGAVPASGIRRLRLRLRVPMPHDLDDLAVEVALNGYGSGRNVLKKQDVPVNLLWSDSAATVTPLSRSMSIASSTAVLRKVRPRSAPALLPHPFPSRPQQARVLRGPRPRTPTRPSRPPSFGLLGPRREP